MPLTGIPKGSLLQASECDLSLLVFLKTDPNKNTSFILGLKTVRQRYRYKRGILFQ